MGIVYLATNKINEKCYVGITKKILNRRKKIHLYSAFKRNSSFVFHNALRKYGKYSCSWI